MSTLRHKVSIAAAAWRWFATHKKRNAERHPPHNRRKVIPAGSLAILQGRRKLKSQFIGPFNDEDIILLLQLCEADIIKPLGKCNEPKHSLVYRPCTMPPLERLLMAIRFLFCDGSKLRYER